MNGFLKAKIIYTKGTKDFHQGHKVHIYKNLRGLRANLSELRGKKTIFKGCEYD